MITSSGCSPSSSDESHALRHDMRRGNVGWGGRVTVTQCGGCAHVGPFLNLQVELLAHEHAGAEVVGVRAAVPGALVTAVIQNKEGSGLALEHGLAGFERAPVDARGAHAAHVKMEGELASAARYIQHTIAVVELLHRVLVQQPLPACERAAA